jgi:hypothetical protein
MNTIDNEDYTTITHQKHFSKDIKLLTIEVTIYWRTLDFGNDLVLQRLQVISLVCCIIRSCPSQPEFRDMLKSWFQDEIGKIYNVGRGCYHVEFKRKSWKVFSLYESTYITHQEYDISKGK